MVNTKWHLNKCIVNTKFCDLHHNLNSNHSQLKRSVMFLKKKKQTNWYMCILTNPCTRGHCTLQPYPVHMLLAVVHQYVHVCWEKSLSHLNLLVAMGEHTRNGDLTVPVLTCTKYTWYVLHVVLSEHVWYTPYIVCIWYVYHNVLSHSLLWHIKAALRQWNPSTQIPRTHTGFKDAAKLLWYYMYM